MLEGPDERMRLPDVSWFLNHCLCLLLLLSIRMKKEGSTLALLGPFAGTIIQVNFFSLFH